MTALVQANPQSAPPTGPRSAGDGHCRQYLTFLLHAEMFAVGILNVKEIIEFGHLTEIPMMPAFIRGVINLRGAVVPVIDLSARFGGAATLEGRRTCIVILEVQDGELRQDIGVMVDAVSEVIEIPDDQIEPPPAFGARIRSDFIQGMGKVAGKFVILLNIVKALSIDDLALLSGVGESEPAGEAVGHVDASSGRPGELPQGVD